MTTALRIKVKLLSEAYKAYVIMAFLPILVLYHLAHYFLHLNNQTSFSFLAHSKSFPAPRSLYKPLLPLEYDWSFLCLPSSGLGSGDTFSEVSLTILFVTGGLVHFFQHVSQMVIVLLICCLLPLKVKIY